MLSERGNDWPPSNTIEHGKKLESYPGMFPIVCIVVGREDHLVRQ
jgi:hypothetical protein